MKEKVFDKIQDLPITNTRNNLKVDNISSRNIQNFSGIIHI